MKFVTFMIIDGSRNHYESVTSQVYKKQVVPILNQT